VSKQLAQGCYHVEHWRGRGRNANPGPIGPKARGLTITPLSHTVTAQGILLSCKSPFNSNQIKFRIRPQRSTDKKKDYKTTAKRLNNEKTNSMHNAIVINTILHRKRRKALRWCKKPARTVQWGIPLNTFVENPAVLHAVASCSTIL